ncbi:MAG TPA: CPBP family intramembrane glutamic endopeptidase [Symbiobacteriaceae bacterium]|nr:CPBP family intramembrane glutamic endopeptidase [Symbiobacteriaceae bacterium]
MPAAVFAAPAAAPAPKPPKHTWLQSIALHLLPGLVPLACMLLLVPLVEAWGLPPVMVMVLGAPLGVLPLQLSILYFLGRKRNGRLSLEGIVVLREKVSVGQLLLIVLALFLWSGLIFMVLGGWLESLLLPFFTWIPQGIRVTQAGLGSASTGIAVMTGVLGMLFIAWLAPIVEELYFRGYLLPRIPASPAGAALTNAILFAVYHFWSPWSIPGRILMVAPMAYAVHKKRSLWISVATHCLLNTVDVVGWIPFLLIK